MALSPSRPLDPAEARHAIADLRPAFGRLEEIQAGDRQIVLSFVKNPTSYNATLREVLQRPGPKHILAAHSNTVVDGEDFAWLWDVELEQLAGPEPRRSRCGSSTPARAPTSPPSCPAARPPFRGP